MVLEFFWDVIPSVVISNHFWWFEILEHKVVCLFCNVCVLCSFHLHMVFVFWLPSCVSSLDSYTVVSGTCFGIWCCWHYLDGKQYVVCFMCVANEGCKHWHTNTSQILSMNNMGNIWYGFKFKGLCNGKGCVPFTFELE
jgi:hypothetical protein